MPKTHTSKYDHTTLGSIPSAGPCHRFHKGTDEFSDLDCQLLQLSDRLQW